MSNCRPIHPCYTEVQAQLPPPPGNAPPPSPLPHPGRAPPLPPSRAQNRPRRTAPPTGREGGSRHRCAPVRGRRRLGQTRNPASLDHNRCKPKGEATTAITAITRHASPPRWPSGVQTRAVRASRPRAARTAPVRRASSIASRSPAVIARTGAAPSGTRAGPATPPRSSSSSRTTPPGSPAATPTGAYVTCAGQPSPPQPVVNGAVIELARLPGLPRAEGPQRSRRTRSTTSSVWCAPAPPSGATRGRCSSTSTSQSSLSRSATIEGQT